MSDLRSELTAREAAELSRLHAAWHAARTAKDYAEADRLRAQLIDWGCMAPDYARWHPVFESTTHRRKRLDARPRYEQDP